jgi:hypothetical protein
MEPAARTPRADEPDCQSSSAAVVHVPPAVRLIRGVTRSSAIGPKSPSDEVPAPTAGVRVEFWPRGVGGDPQSVRCATPAVRAPLSLVRIEMRIGSSPVFMIFVLTAGLIQTVPRGAHAAPTSSWSQRSGSRAVKRPGSRSQPETANADGPGCNRSVQGDHRLLLTIDRLHVRAVRPALGWARGHVRRSGEQKRAAPHT